MPSGILKIYRQAVKNSSVLKYSWVLIATICILALVGYFKLKNFDVFLYAIGVIAISFIAFLFSFLMRTKDVFIRILLYILVTCIVIVCSSAVLAFGSFIFWQKPEFYKRWFPDQTESVLHNQKKVVFHVYHNGKPIEGMAIMADNVGSSAISARDGKVELIFDSNPQLDSIHLRFHYSPFNIDSTGAISLDTFPAYFAFNTKTHNSQVSLRKASTSLPTLFTLSIQLNEQTGGYEKVFIDGKMVTVSLTSTRYNPRIEVTNYTKQRELIIITERGDSCRLSIPKNIDSGIFRIIANC